MEWPAHPPLEGGGGVIGSRDLPNHVQFPNTQYHFIRVYCVSTGYNNIPKPGTKISEISVDFLPKFRFSVLVEKKFRWKNRLKKNRGKIAKNRRFFGEKSEKSDFSRKNPIFPEIWGKL